MRDSGIRDIRALAAAAAELQAIRGDGSRRRTHREVPIAAPRAVHANAPVDVTELSMVLDANRAWKQERAAVHKAAAGLGDGGKACPCLEDEAGYLAILLHLEEISDGLYDGVMEAVHVQLARYVQSLSLAHGVPRMGCPHPHEPAPDLDRAMRKRIEEGIKRGDEVLAPPLTKAGKVPVTFDTAGVHGPTVIPEYVVSVLPAGVLSCFHPACVQPDGRRRRLTAEEVLPDGADTLLTLKQMCLLWGFKYRWLHSIVTDADDPVPTRGRRASGVGAPSTLYRLGDVSGHPKVAKRLADAAD